jgi:diguanylate cyclase (GGDEF)-like protein
MIANQSSENITRYGQSWLTDRTVYGVLIALGLLNMVACFVLSLVRPSEMEFLQFLIAVAPLLAALGSLQRGLSGPTETRTIWKFVAVGLLFWAVGQIAFSGIGAIAVPAQTMGFRWDFFFFVYGIPMLIGMSSVNEIPGLRSCLWSDGAIAALAVTLAYVRLFPVLPGSQASISSADLIKAYNIQNVILACACTVCLFSCPPGERRKVYAALSGFLWIYAMVAVFLGTSNFGHGSRTTFVEVLWEVPFILLLTAVAFCPVANANMGTQRGGASTSDLVIDNLGPLLLALGVIILASEIEREHFAFGVLSITAAVLLFGYRTGIRQRDFMRAHLRVVHDQQALMDANAQLNQKATRDGLTGAYNRRHFNQMLNEEWKRANRGRQSLSLIMVDVDHFKSLNDRYGHPTGDAVLRAIVRSLTTALRRPSDLLARYGGEEFAIILPGVDLQGAMLVAEHMRLSVEKRQIPNDGDASLRIVTVSIGVTSKQPTEEVSSQEMLDKVDAALYRAKSHGRNCICN